MAVFSREGGGVHVLGRGAEAMRPLAATMPITRGRSTRQRLLSRYFEPDLAETLLAWHPEIVHFHSVHIVPEHRAGRVAHSGGGSVLRDVHGGLFRRRAAARAAEEDGPSILSPNGST